MEVNDDALVQQYDLQDGIGHEIFGALDSGGLEEIGDDKDEGLEGLEDHGLSRDGEHDIFLCS